MQSHDDGEFESCQLCEHEQELVALLQTFRASFEQELLHELVQPAATVLCPSTAV